MRKVPCKIVGVILRAKTQHFASVHDDNSHVASIPYFGFIEEIYELNYCTQSQKEI